MFTDRNLEVVLRGLQPSWVRAVQSRRAFPFAVSPKEKKKQKTPEDLQLRKGNFKVIHIFNAVHDSSLKSIVLKYIKLAEMYLSDWYFMT